MFEKWFNKPKQEEEEAQKGVSKNKFEGYGKEGQGLEGEEKEATPKPRLRFEMPGLRGAKEVGSDTLAEKFIRDTLKEIYPDHEVYGKIDFIEKKDTGKILTGTGRGGWSRKVTYSVTYDGRPVENCVLIAHEGLSDDGYSSAGRLVGEETYFKE